MWVKIKQKSKSRGHSRKINLAHFLSRALQNRAHSLMSIVKMQMREKVNREYA